MRQQLVEGHTASETGKGSSNVAQTALKAQVASQVYKRKTRPLADGQWLAKV